MPVVYERGKLKIRIYFRDHNPPHVHIERAEKTAVIDLLTLAVIGNNGFSKRDLTALVALVEEKRAKFLEAWEKYND